MDPLQFLQETKGKQVYIMMVHTHAVSGVLVASDEHGNVIIETSTSSNILDTELTGRRPRSTDSLRFIRGALIKSVSLL